MPLTDFVYDLLEGNHKVYLLTGASLGGLKLALEFLELEDLPVLGHTCSKDEKIFLLKNEVSIQPTIYVDDNADVARSASDFMVTYTYDHETMGVGSESLKTIKKNILKHLESDQETFLL